MKPITRKELYLNKIVGNNDYEIPEKPITTEEFFFAEILGEAVQAPEPLTRYQMYLAKIAGREIGIPYPETRLEYFLAKAAGMDITVPVPITREEIFWSNYSAIVDFEVESVPPLVYKAIEGTLKNYRIYGNTVNGENVGDLVTEGEHAGEYSAPVTVEGKNLLDFDAFASSILETESGTTSVQGQTITLTASKTDYYTYPYLGDQSGVYKIPVLPNTKYVLSWETDNNKNGRIYVFLNGSLSGAQTALQTEKSIKFITQDDTIYATMRFGVYSAGDSITYSNIQLNKGSTVLPYEPYHAPVTTPIYLPEPIKMVGDEAEYIDYAEQKQHKVRKNLLPNTATSQTKNGVTFTVNGDGSIFCNGQASPNNADLVNPDFLLPSGTYILTGCPDGGSDRETYKILIYVNGAWCTNDRGSGANFTLTKTSTVSVRIAVYAGYTCDNLTFYPMIRKADIKDDTYEPYIENTDLDVTLPELPMLEGTNVLTVGTAVQPSKIYVKGQKERE